MLVSRNVFREVSPGSLAVYVLSLHIFWLIRSLGDPMLAAFIVCGPLQLITLNMSPQYCHVILVSGDCFENCQLNITWMPNIKYVRYKPAPADLLRKSLGFYNCCCRVTFHTDLHEQDVRMQGQSRDKQHYAKYSK